VVGTVAVVAGAPVVLVVVEVVVVEVVVVEVVVVVPVVLGDVAVRAVVGAAVDDIDGFDAGAAASPALHAVTSRHTPKIQHLTTASVPAISRWRHPEVDRWLDHPS
jgi:hypothetical protein